MSLLRLDQMESGSWRRPVSFQLQPSEVAVLLGRNGAGKTTFLNTISGLLPVQSGLIEFEGADVTHLDARGRSQMGIRIALEGRQLFNRLSVRRNLLLGAYLHERNQEISKDLEWVLNIFPDLRAKLAQSAGSLSGGQQTMVNIGRALMGKPTLLLLDEPVLGLDPQNLNKVISALRQIQKEQEMSVIVAEQSIRFVRSFTHRIVLMVGGELTFDGSWEEAENNGKLSEIFA